jgi:radical SAM-linked protein
VDLVALNPEAPHPQRPVVQRLRLRYAKRGRMRFTSVRDFQRALERALRRAGVPVAWSQGFSPHPRISYANAVPTAVASESEYVDLALAERCDPAAVAAALDAALPVGLDVVAVAECDGPPIGEVLSGPAAGSSWQIAFPGVGPEVLAGAVTVLLEREQLLVPRVTKSGRTQLDLRAAIVRAWVPDGAAVDAPPVGDGSAGPTCAILRAVVRHGTPSVRPDDVLAGLNAAAGLAPPAPPVATRLAQGLLDEPTGTVVDLLA